MKKYLVISIMLCTAHITNLIAQADMTERQVGPQVKKSIDQTRDALLDFLSIQEFTPATEVAKRFRLAFEELEHFKRKHEQELQETETKHEPKETTAIKHEENKPHEEIKHEPEVKPAVNPAVKVETIVHTPITPAPTVIHEPVKPVVVPPAHTITAPAPTVPRPTIPTSSPIQAPKPSLVPHIPIKAAPGLVKPGVPVSSPLTPPKV